MIDVEEALKEFEDFRITIRKISQSKEHLFSKMEFKVLFYIFENTNITMQDISSEFLVAKSRVTAITNSLLKKDLITYEVDSSDKRKKILKITEKGKSYLIEHKKNHENGFKIIWESFTDEEQKQWLNLTKKTTIVLKNMYLRKEK